MPWDKTPADRAADAINYGPEYRRNAATCKRNANGRCQRCGKPSHQLQADHITPVSQGGTHALSNLQALCVRCHQIKTAREGNAARNSQPGTDPAPRPTTQW